MEPVRKHVRTGYNEPQLIGRMDTTMTTRFHISAVFAALALALALAFVTSTPAAAEPIDEMQAELAAAQEHLAELGQQLSAIESDLAAAEAQLEETQSQIVETEAAIEQTQIELADARALLSTRMRSGYKTGLSGLLDVILGSSSLSDLASRIYYMDKVNEQDANNIEQVRLLEEQLETQKAELEAQKATQEQTLAAAEAQAAEYQQLVADAQAYYNELDAEVQAELARIAAEEEARRQAEEEARRQAEAEAAAAAQQEEQSQEQAAEPEPEPESQTSGVSTAVNAVTSTNQAQETQQQAEESSGGSLENYTPTYSASVIANAQQFIGWPYKWGCYGTNMGGFDCCGLVATAYHLAGYSTPYATGVPGLRNWVTSRGNWKDCNLSNYQQVLNPGDIIFCSMGHVAIYIGGNQMIHAPLPGQYVCQATVYGCIGGGFGG